MWTDAELPSFIERLGIPGLVDVHTHFMPEQVMHKVWEYFDTVSDAHWPVEYRFDEPTRVDRLRELGVIRWTALNYAHRPGMAVWLNEWSAEFAGRHDGCVHSATFFPDADASDYVAEALAAGAGIFKLHLVVGNFDPWHEYLRPVWSQIETAGVPIVIHAGEFPYPTPWTGADRLATILEAHPELRLVIAHLGARDHDALWHLGIRYPNVMWDTTMAFTDFFNEIGAIPDELVRAVGDHPERIVLGTDYPNIPYPYAHQLEALERLGFGDDWLRAVVYENGVRLLGSAGSSA